MKLGILGTGAVGQSLAAGFALRGYDVSMGSGHPEKFAETPLAFPVVSFAEAADHGEALILAVRWSGIDDVIAAIPKNAYAGKVLIDASNPLSYGNGRPESIIVPPEGSAAQHVAAAMPGARVVKGFNVVGAAMMVSPDLQGGPPDMFICGDDGEAKAAVAQICDDLSYPAFDVGALARAAQLEQLAMLWISIAADRRRGSHAFKLLRG